MAGEQIYFTFCVLRIGYSYCSSSTTYVILDDQNRIIAVLVGRPKEKKGRVDRHRWDAVIQRVADLFERARANAARSFTPAKTCHRRGNFAVLNTGISYGGGQQVGDLIFVISWS